MCLASIITFNPDINFLMDNIRAVSNQVNKLLIIDNNSKNTNDFVSIIKSEFKNVDFIFNNNNLGVAEGLNQALNYAKSNNYKWLLTLDQDSVCQADMILQYETFLKSNAHNNILLLCPEIQDINIKNMKKIKCGAEEVNVAITSGSLLNVNNSLMIGGFLTELFIDYVDFEFCLRGRKRNFKILKLNNIVLKHRLGEIQEKKFLGNEIVVTNHNPKRRFYLFRNKIYIYKTYWRDYKHWVLRNILSSIKTMLIILFYEQNKFENFRNIIKGVLDGYRLKIKN
jgi:rhamnosyltransferase